MILFTVIFNNLVKVKHTAELEFVIHRTPAQTTLYSKYANLYDSLIYINIQIYNKMQIK